MRRNINILILTSIISILSACTGNLQESGVDQGGNTNVSDTASDSNVCNNNCETNSGPMASATADIYSGIAPLTVNFKGTATIKSGKIVSYYWDFNGDGVFDYVDPANPDPPAQVYTEPGIYNVKFRVDDDKGLWDVDTITIQVLKGGTLQSEIENANQEFRNEVGKALKEAATLFKKDIDTTGFVAVISESGKYIGINSFIKAAESLTIEEITSGQDILFTFFKLPDNSSIPSGFYVVRFLGEDSGKWIAQFRDKDDRVVFEAPAELGYGFLAEKEKPGGKVTFRTRYKPPATIEITIDWEKSNPPADGEARILASMGSRDGRDSVVLTPEGERIVSAVSKFRSIVYESLISSTTDFGDLIKPDELEEKKLLIASRDDILAAYTIRKGVVEKDILEGRYALYGYIRTRSEMDYQSGKFVALTIQGYNVDNTVSIGYGANGRIISIDDAEIEEIKEGPASPIPVVDVMPLGLKAGLYLDKKYFEIGSDYLKGREEEVIQYVNGRFRNNIENALIAISQKAGINIDTRDFVSAYTNDGLISAINTTFRGIEKKDIGVIADGEDMLLTFIRLPQGSRVPVGAYIVKVYQEQGTPNWYAQLRDAFTNNVVLTTEANVTEGNSEIVGAVESLIIRCCPLQIIVDWSSSGSNGSYSIRSELKRVREDNLSGLEPELINIIRHFEIANTSIKEPILVASKGKGIKKRLNIESIISSGKMFSVISTDETYLSNLSLEDIMNGKDLLFTYLQRAGRDSFFATVSFYDSDRDGYGVAYFRDKYGNTVEYGSGRLNTQAISTIPFAGGGSDYSNFYISLGAPVASLTIKTKSSPP
jgi:PKD repeat protein